MKAGVWVSSGNLASVSTCSSVGLGMDFWICFLFFLSLCTWYVCGGGGGGGECCVNLWTCYICLPHSLYWGMISYWIWNFPSQLASQFLLKSPCPYLPCPDISNRPLCPPIIPPGFLMRVLGFELWSSNLQELYHWAISPALNLVS